MFTFVEKKYRNARILLIDDEPAVCEGQAFTLRHQYGFTQITSHILPREALAELEENPHATDVVLLDLKIPEMDGFTMLARIKNINPAIQIIILSAYSGLSDIRAALAESALVFEFSDIDNDQLKPAILEKTHEQDSQRLPSVICQAYDAKKTGTIND